MPTLLVVEQLLNGLQFGLMLFLLAAGLTLVFGVMDMINLAHGSLYMVGAFVGGVAGGLDRLVRVRRARRGRLTAAVRHGCSRSALLRTLYARDHLSQVLATFALILILNDGVKMVFGTDLPLSAPAALAGPVQLLPGLQLPGVPAADPGSGPGARAAAVPAGARRAWARWCAPARRTAR